VRVSGSLVARHLQQVRSHGAEAVQRTAHHGESIRTVEPDDEVGERRAVDILFLPRSDAFASRTVCSRSAKS
jgi:hypothetical protein